MSGELITGGQIAEEALRRNYGRIRIAGLTLRLQQWTIDMPDFDSVAITVYYRGDLDHASFEVTVHERSLQQVALRLQEILDQVADRPSPEVTL